MNLIRFGGNVQICFLSGNRVLRVAIFVLFFDRNNADLAQQPTGNHD